MTNFSSLTSSASPPLIVLGSRVCLDDDNKDFPMKKRQIVVYYDDDDDFVQQKTQKTTDTPTTFSPLQKIRTHQQEPFDSRPVVVRRGGLLLLTNFTCEV